MLYAFFIFFMWFWFWFWFWFDGLVGGARICGGDYVLVVAWWWRGGYGGDCVLNFLVLFVVASARG